MIVVEMSSFTNSEMDSFLDQVKAVVARGMVQDKIVSLKDADEWCEHHTIILRKKTFFRTLSDKWLKTEPIEKSDYLLIVEGRG